MGNIMENVKKAQQLVQVEAAKAQEELAAYVLPGCEGECKVTCKGISRTDHPIDQCKP